MIEHLRSKNPHIQIYSINDPEFSIYGDVLDCVEFQPFIDYLKNETSIPEEGNQYLPHVEALDVLSLSNTVVHDVFGRVPLEYGFVNGNNTKLNALEFHKSSEINVAATPFILLLAHLNDINDFTIDSSKVKAFFIPEDTVIEVYATTLHFSPCKVSDEGFKCGVILPYGTNMEFISPKSSQGRYNRFLFKTNKWLLNHPENKRMADLHATSGITGENIEIFYSWR